jgi:Na+/melibiose symporter-like transporter
MGTGLIGYEERLGTIGQSAQTAANLCWLVAGLYMFSAICQFVGVAVIYNIDKKTLATMTADLAAKHAENESVPAAVEGEAESAE